MNSPRAHLSQPTVEFVRCRLNAGETFRAVADELGLSKQRIHQIVEAHIPLPLRLRTCKYCGKPLPAGYSRHMHLACRNQRYGIRDNERRRERTYLPRDSLTWGERIAQEEYRRRGYNVLWMPEKCPFDFCVNGWRVDVKAGHLRSKSTRAFEWVLMSNGMSPRVFAEKYGRFDFTERCDLFHCIGVDGEDRYHLLVPSIDAGWRAQLVWKPPGPTKRGSMWDDYLDKWGLLAPKSKLAY